MYAVSALVRCHWAGIIDEPAGPDSTSPGVQHFLLMSSTFGKRNRFLSGFSFPPLSSMGGSLRGRPSIGNLCGVVRSASCLSPESVMSGTIDEVAGWRPIHTSQQSGSRAEARLKPPDT
ncbi:hypothetical protein RRG08_040726 [Elysia crispata]|uniref:Uncharacterized protein n=1 Tax=Elysia crispata TaxID=231223 RepID=A0AAE1BDM8_9GAST|nr:hypothetical protein RRG08_040726 [Elysia crispata]